ncbi:S8 family serine peptidase [Alkaliphilus peptidifermentans]|uniref:S-layer homology domain-containing protein n=1 Tax=Alkaliphilus peptidifermentans DSM 18978 TaxID=1120976 RepID=A0A1G5L6B2_9FIRM|nr:S8 family serine peptidase [Alkaliphilus peptidifermentans]SCZ07729.1 S-layer homology domain-containing protein [Alkaliphilus peptidifermentans DSM 18978]
MLKRRKSRIFIATILSLSMILMTCTTVFASIPSDISSHWANDIIQKWLDEGFASGYSDGTFKPDNNISRAEFMVLTNNAFGYSEIKNINYEDVPSGSWYESDVAIAAAAGYINGYPDGTMKPNATITRQEIATIISRIQNLSSNPDAALTLSDEANISEWAKGYVGAVIEAGYMSGYSDGSFLPKKYATRAEALVTLDNAMSRVITQLTDDNGIYEEAGLYGPIEGIETIEKDVTIKADGVILQNIKINGDLIITEEVGEGTVTLNNLIVEGNTLIRGGGTDSIIINGGMYKNIIIEEVQNKVRIVAKGAIGPDGKHVDIIITDGVSDDEVIFEGDFNNITVEKNLSGVKLIFNEGTNVENLVLNSPTGVSGLGNIKNTIENYKPSTPTSSSGGSGGSGGSGDSGDTGNSPPQNATGYPKIGKITDTTMELLLKTNEAGRAYYTVLLAGANAPSSTQVKAGQDSTGSVLLGNLRGSVELIANTEAIVTIKGLTELTNYDIYIVADDDKENLQNEPVKLIFTTKATEITTNGSGYFKIESEDNTKFIEGFVTHGRGGPPVSQASVIYTQDIFENPGDVLITKNGYATTRIQNAYWKSASESIYGQKSVTEAVYGWDELNYVFEVPIRDVFNPNWTNTPPELHIEGINPGDVVSGIVNLDISLKSGDEFYLAYVYMGGEQRFPREAFAQRTDRLTVNLNTTGFPNGHTYIKILVYDEFENAVMLVMPVTVENEVVSEALPGSIAVFNIVSTTYNINIGFYSMPLNDEETNITESYTRPDVSINNTLAWSTAVGASGYKVYRSIDGEDFKYLGAVKTGRFDDFSHAIEIGKKIEYKIVPYNSLGDNEKGAISGFVVPLPPINVYLDSPQHGSKDVNLLPTFRWNVVSGGGNLDDPIYGGASLDFDFTLFDATGWKIHENTTIYDQLEYTLPFELNPGGIYSWDISDGNAFALFRYDATGYSYSISSTNTGSTNGENIFTTTIKDIESPSGMVVDYLNYQGANYDAEQILVKTNNFAELEKSLEHYGSETLKLWQDIGWSLVKIPKGETVEGFIHKLLKDENIIIAQPDFIMEAPKTQVVDDQLLLMNQLQEQTTVANVGPDVVLDKLWGLENINAYEAWQQTTGDDKVILAIIDTGVSTSHQEFADKVFIAPYDATGEDNPNVDYNGHGTHVAGIAGANGRNGVIAGIAWDSPIMPVRVQDRNGSTQTSYLIEGTKTVTDFVVNNPEYRAVINMSIGGRGYDFALKDAIDYALDNNVVFVTSVGNDSKRVPSYPASYNGVITVAASTPHNTKADFSTSGSWISVAAPGDKIYSTYSSGRYHNLRGSSMASPHVAGAAALLLSKYPDLTPIEVKNQLEQTAQGDGFNEELGYGVIDINAMLGAIKPMQYGSLTVNTNINEIGSVTRIGHGVISIFDDEDNLFAYGLTGEKGGHIFHSMPQGDYQVVLVYYDPYKDEYSFQEEKVSIYAAQSKEITINFSIPQSINRTLLYQENIDIENSNYEIPITIVEEGLFEVSTSFYTRDSNLSLYIVDANGDIVAYDSSGKYPSIMLALPAGDYTIIIEGYWYESLNCTLEIHKITANY